MKGFSLSMKTVTPILAIGFLALSGCGGGAGGSGENGQEGMSAAAQPMSTEVQGLVNQGNEAQRAREYEAALDFYRQAMELDADHPVPQFGALMAAMALGNQPLADSLIQKLQVTSPDLLAMLNPDGSMGGGMPANPHAGGMPGATPPQGAPGQAEGLPAGHPTLYEVTPDTVRPDTSGSR